MQPALPDEIVDLVICKLAEQCAAECHMCNSQRSQLSSRCTCSRRLLQLTLVSRRFRSALSPTSAVWHTVCLPTAASAAQQARQLAWLSQRAAVVHTLLVGRLQEPLPLMPFPRLAAFACDASASAGLREEHGLLAPLLSSVVLSGGDLATALPALAKLPRLQHLGLMALGEEAAPAFLDALTQLRSLALARRQGLEGGDGCLPPALTRLRLTACEYVPELPAALVTCLQELVVAAAVGSAASVIRALVPPPGGVSRLRKLCVCLHRTATRFGVPHYLSELQHLTELQVSAPAAHVAVNCALAAPGLQRLLLYCQVLSGLEHWPDPLPAQLVCVDLRGSALQCRSQPALLRMCTSGPPGLVLIGGLPPKAVSERLAPW